MLFLLDLGVWLSTNNSEGKITVEISATWNCTVCDGSQPSFKSAPGVRVYELLLF